MKNILKKLILITVAIFTVSACSDDWTKLESEYAPSYDNFYKTEADAIKAINAVYDYMDDEDMFGRGFFWFIHASDDMVTGRPNGTAEKIRNFKVSGSEGYIYWMYTQSYKVIRRCNDVLANVPKISFKDEKLKNRILGEAYFMRAFHYFWISHTYGDNGTNGGVPIVTVENMDAAPGSYKRPKSVTENYKQLIEDLETAAEKLPYFTDLGSANYGRPHKDAAWAYIAKTYLYWAQYDSSKYAKAIEYADKVINSPTNRQLVNTGNPKEDYRRLHSHLENWGTEYIWSVNSGLNGGSKLPGIALERAGWSKYNGWGYFMPTKELYDAYSNDDARRGITILKYKDTFKYFGKTKVYGIDTVKTKEGVKVVYGTNSTSGYQFNKYMYEYGFDNPINQYINPNGNDGSTLYNVPLLRFAEILLIKAEAKIMLGQNADAEINKIRNRAGLSSITGANLQNLKRERRLELAGEFANRHFDLIRWGDAKEAYSKPSTGEKFDKDKNIIYFEVWKARNFDPSYMHVWPIPSKVITNTGIAQNKGW